MVLSELEIHLNLIKNLSYNQDSYQGYFLEVDVQYPEELHELHSDIQILPRIMKSDKVENFQSTCIRMCYSHKKFEATIKS